MPVFSRSESCLAYSPWAHWKFFRTVALRQYFHFQCVVQPTIPDHIENSLKQLHCASIFTVNELFRLQSMSRLKILYNSCTAPVFSVSMICLAYNPRAHWKFFRTVALRQYFYLQWVAFRTISHHIENSLEQLHCASIFTFNDLVSPQSMSTLKIFENSCTAPVFSCSVSCLAYNPWAHWTFFTTVALHQHFHFQWDFQPTIPDHIENSLKQLHCASSFTFSDFFSLQSMSTLKILQNSCTVPIFSLFQSMSTLKILYNSCTAPIFYFQWVLYLTIHERIENSLQQLHCANIFTFNALFTLQSMSTLKIL